jgi:hypothetical protein
MDSENAGFGLSKSKVDQAAYNFTESQAATTYAGSVMAGTRPYDDDARTNASIYSYTSGMDAAKLRREAYGRVSDRLALEIKADQRTRQSMP